jgi:hypothetical protein
MTVTARSLDVFEVYDGYLGFARAVQGRLPH